MLKTSPSSRIWTSDLEISDLHLIYSLPLYQLSYRRSQYWNVNKDLFERFEIVFSLWRKSDTKLRNRPYSRDHIVQKTQNSQGGLAQVVERSICIREAPGSIPGFSSFQYIVATVAKGVLVIPRLNSTRIRFRTTCGFDFWRLKMCRDPGLNQGPSDLQSDALPTELSRLAKLDPGRWVLDVNCRFLRFSHNSDR